MPTLTPETTPMIHGVFGLGIAEIKANPIVPASPQVPSGDATIRTQTRFFFKGFDVVATGAVVGSMLLLELMGFVPGVGQDCYAFVIMAMVSY